MPINPSSYNPIPGPSQPVSKKPAAASGVPFKGIIAGKIPIPTDGTKQPASQKPGITDGLPPGTKLPKPPGAGQV